LQLLIKFTLTFTVTTSKIRYFRKIEIVIGRMSLYRKTLFFLLVSLLSPFSIYGDNISYTVDFEGLDDASALKTIRSASQLITLKKHPPASLNALRYRAEADVPDILKVLHAHGYYEATVDIRMDEALDQIAVKVIIHSGPVYKIDDYSIHLYSENPEHPIECSQIDLRNIGIVLGKPGIAQKILDAELRILQLLSECGFPLASIAKRDIIADGESKTLRINVEVNTGPLALFGSVTIQGQTTVKNKFIKHKIAWIKREKYNSTLVEQTQKVLMDTGLFSSVLITHADKIAENGLIPMKIEVTESKHHSINVGASYQTVFGPGLTFGWENRNIGGMGRKFSLQGDITRISHTGLATYQIPDFRRRGQDWLWQAQAMHESITAYSERSYSITSRLERKFGKKIHVSGGARGEQMHVTGSVDNGKFLLLELPIYFRWSNANSLLNPTNGATFEYRTSPSFNVDKPSGMYFFQELTQSFYHPFTKNHYFVIAHKLTLGSIISRNLHPIPVPKRFLGGSEEDLRGYKYKTVSPLHHHHKPIGGRSAVYYTLETRFRVTQSIGLVPFFDIGNVYLTQLPKFTGKWLKSVGLGIRYFTFIGPFRLDIGFPLDRRKRLDPKYQIFVSIGQMF
jgi:translocation and assembly module TamA